MEYYFNWFTLDMMEEKVVEEEFTINKKQKQTHIYLAVPGADLLLTINSRKQPYVKDILQNKTGMHICHYTKFCSGT